MNAGKNKTLRQHLPLGPIRSCWLSNIYLKVITSISPSYFILDSVTAFFHWDLNLRVSETFCGSCYGAADNDECNVKQFCLIVVLLSRFHHLAKLKRCSAFEVAKAEKRKCKEQCWHPLDRWAKGIKILCGSPKFWKKTIFCQLCIYVYCI